jgi:hypothetical protein
MRMLRRVRLRRAIALPAALITCAAMLWMTSQPASATLPGPVVAQGEGFDSSAVPTEAQMTTWWTETPYIGAGVYLGGENSGGHNPGHDWLAHAMGIGWAVWLYWVGPQSQCVIKQPDDAVFLNSGNPTAVGEAQAQDALAAAKADGFGNVYIVYDMEGFDTTPACVTAAELFINGWEYEMHTVLHAHGAVYGSSCASDISAYVNHSNIPEAIFPASGDHAFATTPISCIANNKWDHNQRVHQFTSGTNLRTGPGDPKVIFNIDEDCLDGPAQATSPIDTTCA